MAWGAGLLGGPAVGGFAYERIGFARLTVAWGVGLLIVTAVIQRHGSRIAVRR